MAKPKDHRMDAYIAGAEDFARPILPQFLNLVYAARPVHEGDDEVGFSAFSTGWDWRSMAAFKRHCATASWKSELVFGPRATNREAMGHFGRITSRLISRLTT